MGFMKMLAQNTQIDGRSRWEDAERMLRDDPRFKAVPESSDREDLFNEFVDALTKKEKVRALSQGPMMRCSTIYPHVTCGACRPLSWSVGAELVLVPRGSRC